MAKLCQLSLYLHTQDKTQLVTIYHLENLHLLQETLSCLCGAKSVGEQYCPSFMEGKSPLLDVKVRCPKSEFKIQRGH